MSSRPASISEIFMRLRLRGQTSGTWIAIVANGGVSSNNFRRFRDEFEILSGEKIRTVECESRPIEEILRALHRPDFDTVVIIGFSTWHSPQWEALDINRSGAERNGSIILWLNERAAVEMSVSAPNVRSYVSASLFYLGPDTANMTDLEKNSRLQELRERFRLRDDEVVQMAKDGVLPKKPSFVEWLVLLDREDLI